MAKPLSVFDRRNIPSHAREDWWQAPDGWPIRRIDWPVPPAAKGSILFVAGRSDMYEKYLETLDQLNAGGWCVTAIDWRGQAGSGRFLDDPHIGHIDDFSVWVGDLENFYAAWAADMPGPHVVLAHSMGGHLALRALAERRIAPDAMILSAPMLGLKGAGIPAALAHGIARLMVAMGLGRKAAWRDVSETPFAGKELRAHQLTHDSARYEDEQHWLRARPDIALGPASWGWINAAYRSSRQMEAPGLLEAIHTPILIVATRSDRLVDAKAIEKAAKRLPNCAMMMFGNEAAHELLREADPVRDRVMDRIWRFLGSIGNVRQERPDRDQD